MNLKPRYVALWGLGLATVVVLQAGSLFLGDLNQDEGWYLYGARLVAEGQRPFVDFATTQGPVMSYAYALAQPLVDAWGVAGGRLATAVLGFLAILATTVLASSLVRATPAEAGGEPVPECAPAHAAVIALFLAGVNVFQCYYFSIVKTYSLAGLLILCGYLALSTAPGRRARLGPFIAGLCLALAAATRLSAVFAAASVWVALLLARDVEPRAARARWGWYTLGAVLAGLVAFLPFLLAAPQAFWSGLVTYHAGREVGGPLTGAAYKAGFVSRQCLGYTAAVGVGVGLVAHAWWEGGPPRRRGGWLTGAVWGGAAAVSLIHFLAPFPYDDYQAMIYPLAAAGLAAALARRCARFWSAAAVAALCLVCVAGSPMMQSWFIGPRDRIWWPLKAHAPLTVLRETAAQIRALPGVQRGDELLTQDPYLAVEAGMRLPRGLELGQFSYFPDWSDDQARRSHVLNAASFRALLRSTRAPVAAFSGYGFAIRAPEVMALPEAEQRELWGLVESRYRAVAEIVPFGQADTRLRILALQIP